MTSQENGKALYYSTESSSPIQAILLGLREGSAPVYTTLVRNSSETRGGLLTEFYLCCNNLGST